MTGIPDFWERLGTAGQTVLLLDYDGTLAPFHVNRFRAFPLPGSIDAVERIAAQPDSEVALISGRPVSEVRTLIVSERLAIVGTHGFEFYRPGRGIETWSLSDAQVRALDDGESFANDLVGAARTERKVATVAVHLRGLPETEAVRVVHQFEKFCATISEIGEMEVRGFDGGVELRAKGRDKGAAVRDLLAEFPPADLVVYIGDDDTDEDAFRDLPPGDVGIKVGPYERPTRAQGRLPSTEAVRQFLWSWISVRSRT